MVKWVLYIPHQHLVRDAIAARNAKPEVPPMLIKNKNDDLVPLVDLQGKFVKELGF